MSISIHLAAATVVIALFLVVNATFDRVGRESCAKRFDNQTCNHLLNR